MIVAIILIDPTPVCEELPAALLEVNDQTILERIAATVLRGPFGGTVVASPLQYSKQVREALHGFTVKYIDVSNSKGPHQSLSMALKAAAQFRTRWEKAKADAAARFPGRNDEDDSEGENSSKKTTSHGAEKPKEAQAERAEWSQHRQNPDVKIRGLARSFDSEGVVLFRAEYPLITLELQAQLVEVFGREFSADKNKTNAHSQAVTHAFAQAIYEGQRGYPIVMSTAAADEVTALPPTTDFDAWLLTQLPRIKDVNVPAAGAVECIRSEDDFEKLYEKIEKHLLRFPADPSE